ncbi:4-hydroxy-2-oxovalerate aldolase [compost metagenome]
MGSMNPDQMALVINWLRKHWTGSLGVHTHDNMGLALQNSLRSMIEGVTWIDATVTGMGRGPGNAKTEYLALEIAENRGTKLNLVPLMALIKKTFAPMQYQHGWGTNTYYYLAGRYGIHPTYIQEMLSDTRYSEEDVLAVIDHLRLVGGKKFSVDTLDTARNFYQGVPRGSWDPKSLLEQREVLLIGAGPSVSAHRDAIQSYIRRVKPFVMVLNTQSQIEANLIDARVACHPVRLLADCEVYSSLPQPLITPASMLPDEIKDSLCTSTLLDFGVGIKENTFEVHEHHAILPNPLVVGYALAIALGGKVSNLKLAGFDGYGAGDPRTIEMQTLFDTFKQYSDSVGFCSITPTYYSIPIRSIYAI